MKRAMSISLLVLWQSVALAQAGAVQDFEKIVSRAEAFFLSPQLLYDVQTYSDSPTGRIAYVHRISATPVKYDVKKTDSLVTPIVGFLTFDIALESTTKCGSVKSPYTGSFGATIEEAQELAGRESCWETGGPAGCAMIFNYGYSSSRWELRNIVSNPPACQLMFDHARGALDRRNFHRTSLNMQWLKMKDGFVAPMNER